MKIHRQYKDRLSQLIASPSISSTTASLDMSNRGVIDYLADWFVHLGFDCEIMAVEEGKFNLIATLGKGPGGLVLAGHTDTVPCNPDRWQQDPFTLREHNSRYYGLGATDMKGFFPVVLAALESLGEQRFRLQQPVIVLATADEESSMCGARALADAGHPKARYAIIGEPTGMRPVRMHKGIIMESVRVQGIAGHSSNPALGRNALETMHTIIADLLSFREELQIHRHPGFTVETPTLNLGHIHGGDNPNRICGTCELHFDLRPVPGLDIEELHQQIEKRLRPLGESRGTPVTLQRLIGGIDAFEQSPNSELVQMAERLTGHSSQAVAFATEAPFMKRLGMQTLVMGPGSIDQAHQPDEYIDHDQILPAIEVITSLIRELCLKTSAEPLP